MTFWGVHNLLNDSSARFISENFDKTNYRAFVTIQAGPADAGRVVCPV